jgi:1,4-dihydroxy-2-naphthoyl-CoA synthase
MGLGALDLAEAERIIARAADSDDYCEGRDAFAAKRAPDFKGR